MDATINVDPEYPHIAFHQWLRARKITDQFDTETLTYLREHSAECARKEDLAESEYCIRNHGEYWHSRLLFEIRQYHEMLLRGYVQPRETFWNSLRDVQGTRRKLAEALNHVPYPYGNWMEAFGWDEVLDWLQVLHQRHIYIPEPGEVEFVYTDTDVDWDEKDPFALPRQYHIYVCRGGVNDIDIPLSESEAPPYAHGRVHVHGQSLEFGSIYLRDLDVTEFRVDLKELVNATGGCVHKNEGPITTGEGIFGEPCNGCSSFSSSLCAANTHWLSAPTLDALATKLLLFFEQQHYFRARISQYDGYNCFGSEGPEIHTSGIQLYS